MMKPKFYPLCALITLAAASAFGQQPSSDPFGENLFSPELVMQHQQALGLNEDQKNFFKVEMRKAHARFTELQWQLQDEMEKLVSLVKQDQIDEQQVLAQLDKVLNAEREIKHIQISLVVRIKNKLTPEQQARLREIKSRAQSK
jgi:Spy/CpxP family protein refolding chaperone